MNGVGSNEYGVVYIKELIVMYQFEIVEFKYKVLMIFVNRSLKDVDFYDVVCFSWCVSFECVSKVEVILVIVKGIVRGVYVVDEWLKFICDNFFEMC